MAKFKLGEAYVDLSIDPRKYNAGLAAAETAINQFAKRIQRMPVLKLPTYSVGLFTTALKTMNGVMAAGIPIAQNYATALAGVTGGTRGINAMLRAMANAQAQIIRAQGAARGSIIKGLGSAFADVVKAFGSGLSNVIRATGSLARGLGSMIAAPLRAITGFLSSKFALLGGLFAGIGAGFTLTEITGQAREAESAMARLAQVTGLEGKAIRDMAAGFSNIAATMPGVKLGDVFGIGEIGARLGVGAEELELFTRDIARVSAIMKDVPVEELSNRFASLLTVFDRGYHETQNLASAVNKLDQMSTATARDILDISSRMGGAASFLGLTPQKTLALATAMRQARVEIETAGTAMAQIMLRMADPKFAGAFARMAGMTTEAFTKLKKEDPAGAVRAIVAGLGQLEKGRAVTMLDSVQLDGQRVRGVLLKLIPVLDEWDTYTKAAEKEWQGMTSILRAFGIQAETADSLMVQMWNNIQLTARAIGTHLLPVIKGFAKGIMDLSVDVRMFLEDNSIAFEEWGQKIGRVISYVGLLWKEWPLFIEYAVGFALDKVDQLQEVMVRLGTVIKNTFRGIVSVISDLFMQLGKMIGDHVHNAIANMVNKLIISNPKLAMVLGLVPIPTVIPQRLKMNLAPMAAAAAMNAQAMPNGVFGGLPNNRAAALRDIAADIEQARVDQEARRAALVAGDEARADRIRGEAAFRADMLRNGGPRAMGPPPGFRRPLNFPRPNAAGLAARANALGDVAARDRDVLARQQFGQMQAGALQAARGVGGLFGVGGLLGGGAGAVAPPAVKLMGKAAIEQEKRAKAARIAAGRAQRKARLRGGKIHPVGLPGGVPKPAEPIDPQVEAVGLLKEEAKKHDKANELLVEIKNGILDIRLGMI